MDIIELKHHIPIVELFNIYLNVVNQCLELDTFDGQISELIRLVFTKVCYYPCIFLTLLLVIARNWAYKARLLFNNQLFIDAFYKIDIKFFDDNVMYRYFSTYESDKEMYEEYRFWKNCFELIQFLHGDIYKQNLQKIGLKFLDIFDFSYFVHGNRDINNFKKIINGMGEYILEFVVSNKKLKQLIQGTMVDYYNSYGIGCNIMTHTILRYYNFHPLIDENSRYGPLLISNYYSVDYIMRLCNENELLHLDVRLENSINNFKHNILQNYLILDLTKIVLDYMGITDFVKNIS